MVIIEKQWRGLGFPSRLSSFECFEASVEFEAAGDGDYNECYTEEGEKESGEEDHFVEVLEIRPSI